MKILLILIYILLLLISVYFSTNIEKYTDIKINKLDDININGNVNIKTTDNIFNLIKEICIKDKCVSVDKLITLPNDVGSNGTCTAEQCTKVCQCPYGTVASGDDCKIHGAETCVSCKQNYKFDNIEKKCKPCEEGTIIDDDNHNITICCSQTQKIHNGNVCKNNECLCDNGEGDNENCEDVTVKKCKSCNSGFYFENDKCKQCNEELFTPDGNRDGKCCAIGQHYDNGIKGCLTNKCTCNGGTGTEGEKCEVHNSENCDSCKGGEYGEYYKYSTNTTNTCVRCDFEEENYYNNEIIYSNNHRITECCPKNTFQNRFNYKEGDYCKYKPNYNKLCRNGEIYINNGVSEVGYCECPKNKKFDFVSNMCIDKY